MRDDLLDAQSAVDWTRAQIPLFLRELDAWQKRYPYRVIEERDLESGDRFVVALQDKTFPLTFNVWIGATLNSLRSSLDLLATALAARNGKAPNRDWHFPLFESFDKMNKGIDGAKYKGWLSQQERDMIRALKPYSGGDETLWPLHRLDILRKHERLIRGILVVHAVIQLTGASHKTVWRARAAESRNHKTVLARLAPTEHLSPSKHDILVDVIFTEVALGIVDAQVIPFLRKFLYRIQEIIILFDVV
ncbi:MAG: hypothetical protein WA459_25565 [Stellaceae bacterium]